MENKSSSHLMRSAAFRYAVVAVGLGGRNSGVVSRAIGRDQEEAGLMTGAVRAAMAVFGSERYPLPAVTLLLIFAVYGGAI